jgi:hypothetical protein
MPNSSNGFDVNAARQAGYSDDEILQHLTSSRKFDVASALKAGYSKADIIQHLANAPAAPSIPGAPDGLPGVPKPPNPILGENIVSRHRMIPGPGGGFPQDYAMPEAQVERGQNAVNAALGTAATGVGLVTAPVATIGALTGGYAGGKGGRQIAKSLGAGETGQDIAEGAGNLAGGAAGGIGGSLVEDSLTSFIKNAVASIARNDAGNILSPTEMLWSPVKKVLDATVPMTAEQQAARDATQFAAGPSANIKTSPYFDKTTYQNGILARKTPSGLPVGNPTPFAVGSASQEAGWQPSVTKVPIRQEPQYNLTPQSVPGPDTSGKGNLLTPLAKRGDPRAAAELQRRGRTVIYMPDSDTPLYMDSDAFANLLKGLQK